MLMGVGGVPSGERQAQKPRCGTLMATEKQQGGQCLEGRRQGERQGVRFRGQGRPAQARPLALDEMGTIAGF